VVVRLVEFQKGLGVVSVKEALTAAHAEFGGSFTAREWEESRRQLPTEHKLRPWGRTKSFT
jgi:hypothetical protein